MKILLFGLGMQGKAVVYDLERTETVTEIVAAEMELEAARRHVAEKGYRKTRIVQVDASREAELNRLIRETGAPVVICMLPPELGFQAARAAIACGSHFVSTNYTGRLAELDAPAREKDVILLPEMGMDPGIDLVMARTAMDELDEVHGLYSYGGGLPEPAAAGGNPLRYKITWTFDGVLSAYKRPGRLLKDGKEIVVSGADIFRPEHGHTIDIPGIGPLEAFPNGDALNYIDLLSAGAHIREAGRFTLRYPGHCRLWSALSDLGFLDDAPLNAGSGHLSPHQFLVRHLTPRLQFGPEERDVAVLRVHAWGIRNGRKRSVTCDLIDYRDPATGFFAMNRTVGFTVSIAAQMILAGQIRKRGLCSPARDVPPQAFFPALKARGMSICRHIAEWETL